MADQPNEDNTQSFIALSKGTAVSQYKIIEMLGSGGMGEVYLAEDTNLKRKVALKFLPEVLQKEEIVRKRFLLEAKSAAALDHPFICKIYETGQAAGRSFIAMEYVEGKTLSERIAGGPITPREVVRIVSEVTEALGKAHGAGIVHRDLKPSNISFD